MLSNISRNVSERSRGFIAVKPNCSIQSYAPVLTAWKEFEPYEVVATTYQAISGAGKDIQRLAGDGTQHYSVILAEKKRRVKRNL